MKVEKEIKSIINFIKKTFISDDFKGVVIGVDGYIDSSVVAALFTKALGKENVLVVAIPNT